MKKLSKKAMKKQFCGGAGEKPAKDVGGSAKKCFGKILGKCAGKFLVFGFLAFAVTFCIYMFNLENKLIYYVVRPFLNKHYDAQTRDRKV